MPVEVIPYLTNFFLLFLIFPKIKKKRIKFILQYHQYPVKIGTLMQLCTIEVQINFPYITFSNSSLFLIKHPIQY